MIEYRVSVRKHHAETRENCDREILVQLLFAGDVMLGRLVNEALKSQTPAYPWGDTLGLFRQASWRMCNLECALSDRGTPWSPHTKVFHFRSDAKNAAVLQAAGIDAVSLANNHALDYGEDALLDTLRILDDRDIARAGAGATADEARQLTVSKAGDVHIGLLAFTDNMPEWDATDTSPGVYYVPAVASDPRAQQLLANVRKATEAVGLLVVSAHWGPNWGRKPPLSHVELGRALIDAGADVVFGHSAHIFRGVEFYKGRPILYSTGDFVDDYAVDPVERNDWSFVFVVDVPPRGAWQLKLYPTLIRRYQAVRALEPDRRQIVDRMMTLCSELGARAVWKPEHGRLEVSG